MKFVAFLIAFFLLGVVFYVVFWLCCLDVVVMGLALLHLYCVYLILIVPDSNTNTNAAVVPFKWGTRIENGGDLYVLSYSHLVDVEYA